MYCQTIRSVIDISRDDRERIATCSLRTPTDRQTDRLMENYSTFILNRTLFGTIYHQGFFHSARRNPSLKCFHRRRSLVILGHAGPRGADKSVSPSCFRSSLSSCPFSWCPHCHSFRQSVVFESGNVSRPSMYSLLDNVYDDIHTCLMAYPCIAFMVTQGDAEHDALHFFAVRLTVHVSLLQCPRDFAEKNDCT